MSVNSDCLQVIPLGGVGEIGKNMFVLKYGQEMLVLDAGLKFPEEDMLGIDVVIPDISFLLEYRSLIKGIILTHGHEDHIGAIPYIISELNVPVYGTRLTLGLLRAKMDEFEQLRQLECHEITADQRVKISPSFELDFFRTNHSIPDSVGVIIYNPVGTVVYTSDYKFDQTPVDGKITDFYKLAKLGRKGVLVALSDSTNSDRPGFTPSEKEVGKTIDDIFRLSQNRIIFATFASNIHRIQQVIDAAYLHRRKICVVGRSIINSVQIASELGYLKIPEGIIIDPDQIGQYPPQKLAVITTGSQGEPMSALTRISVSEHRWVEIIEGDTVIISASPIPGNEKLVARTVNNLFQRGADVISQPLFEVHVSGHAGEEEIKMMLNLLRPTYLIPVHGEYRHQVYQARIAEKVGIPRNNIFLVEPGTVMEFSREQSRINGTVAAGKVLVDGLGIGDVGRVVLRDRRLLSEDGIVVVVLVIDPQQKAIVAGPEIITRGFIYVRESEHLLERARNTLLECLLELNVEQLLDWNIVKSRVRDAAGTFFYDQTGRRPIILPVIMETSSK
ncbi:MAG TPA: ribonuclease J [Firmicutes bacterium]|nr:ribonuclease J [Bacillota bacterium]